MNVAMNVSNVRSKGSTTKSIQVYNVKFEHMLCFERFGTTCTILKREKHQWASVTLQPTTLLKVTLLHRS